ncbi:hypothetical protein QTN25_001150 [Entamoeba marina]
MDTSTDQIVEEKIDELKKTVDFLEGRQIDESRQNAYFNVFLCKLKEIYEIVPKGTKGANKTIKRERILSINGVSLEKCCEIGKIFNEYLKKEIKIDGKKMDNMKEITLLKIPQSVNDEIKKIDPQFTTTAILDRHNGHPNFNGTSLPSYFSLMNGENIEDSIESFNQKHNEIHEDSERKKGFDFLNGPGSSSVNSLKPNYKK